MEPETLQEDSDHLEGLQPPEIKTDLEDPGQPEAEEVFPTSPFTSGSPLNTHRVQNQEEEIQEEFYQLELGPLTFIHDPSDGLSDQDWKARIQGLIPELPVHPRVQQFCALYKCTPEEATSQDPMVLEKLAARAPTLPYTLEEYQRFYPVTVAAIQEWKENVQGHPSMGNWEPAIPLLAKLEQDRAEWLKEKEVQWAEEQSVARHTHPGGRKNVPDPEELAPWLNLSPAQKQRLPYNQNALPLVVAENLAKGQPAYQDHQHPPCRGEQSLAMGKLEIFINGFDHTIVDASRAALKARLSSFIEDNLGYVPHFKMSQLDRGFIFLLAPTLKLACDTIVLMTGYISAGDELLADWSDNQRSIFTAKLGHTQPTRDTPWNPQWDLYPELALDETAPRAQLGREESPYEGPPARHSGPFYGRDSHGVHGDSHGHMEYPHYGEASYEERGNDGASRFAPWDYRHPSWRGSAHILDRSTSHPRGKEAQDDYTCGRITPRVQGTPREQSIKAAARGTNQGLQRAAARQPPAYPHHRFEEQHDLVLCIWCGARSPPANPECPGNPDFYARS